MSKTARQSFAGLGDTASAVVAKLTPERAPSEILRDLPGHGITTLDLGVQRLQERARDLGIVPERLASIAETAWAQFSKGTVLCESPIERSMLGGLLTANWRGYATIPPLVHDVRGTEPLPAGDVLIVPQFAFARFRVDFLVAVEINDVRRMIAVECDGERFHMHADKERARVAYLEAWGIRVFKFKGSDIHADAMAAADRVAQFASEWKQTA